MTFIYSAVGVTLGLCLFYGYCWLIGWREYSAKHEDPEADAQTERILKQQAESWYEYYYGKNSPPAP